VASEQFIRYLSLLRRVPAPEHADYRAIRESMDRTGGRFPDGVKGTSVMAGRVPAEWIDSSSADMDRVVLYFHGGGYVAGSIDSHRNLTGHIAKAVGCRVLALDYRLAPEHPHPAPVVDAVNAYRWLLAQDYAADHIVIAGDSAGGGLAVATLLRARSHELPLPAGTVLMSPLVDLEATGSSMTTRASMDPLITKSLVLDNVGLFIGDGDRRDPDAAPLHGDLTGLPPMLIQVGDAEVLLDDAVRLAALAETVGVRSFLEVWPEMVHVFQASASYVPEADQAIARIAEFCRYVLELP
jgi:epsilon-lactone hydrolase